MRQACRFVSPRPFIFAPGGASGHSNPEFGRHGRDAREIGCDPPVSSLDILPTALAAAGVEPPDKAKLDGVDLRPYLEGREKRPPHGRLFWRYGGIAAVRVGRWKLGREGGRKPWQLFDLARDMGESRDLAAAEPGVATLLEAAWTRWDAELVKPLWGNGPP